MSNQHILDLAESLWCNDVTQPTTRQDFQQFLPSYKRCMVTEHTFISQQYAVELTSRASNYLNVARSPRHRLYPDKKLFWFRNISSLHCPGWIAVLTKCQSVRQEWCPSSIWSE